MTNKPVESLKEGGLWWFVDLTSVDPYYLLPLGTSITLYAVTSYTLRNSQNLTPIMRNMFKAVPVISFIFAMKFPGVRYIALIFTLYRKYLKKFVLGHFVSLGYFKYSNRSRKSSIAVKESKSIF